jgi:hypothetical protein
LLTIKRMCAENARSFLVVLAITIAAIGQSFLIAVPSLDTWFRLASWNGTDQLFTQLLSQDRFGQAVLFRFLDLFDYQSITVAFSALMLATLFLVANAFLLMEFIEPGRKPAFALIAASVLFCIQPNSAEIFTFADVTLAVQISYFLGFVALILSIRSDVLSTISAIILLLMSLSLYQLSANYVACAICLRFAYRAATGTELKSTFRATTVLITGMVIYLVAAKLVVAVSGIGSVGRAELVGLWDAAHVLTKIREALLLAFFPFWISKVTSSSALILTLVGLAILALSALRNSTFSRSILVLASLVGALASVAGVAVLSKEPWLVARVLSAASVFIGGSVLIGLLLAKSTSIRICLLLGTVVTSIGYMAADNRIFFDQRRLFNWDSALANRILARLEMLPEFEQGIQTITYVGARQHSAGPPTQAGDMNHSAAVPVYSQAPMFEQATGVRLNRLPTMAETDLAKTLCAASAKWPDQASVRIVNRVAVVCF